MRRPFNRHEIGWEARGYIGTALQLFRTACQDVLMDAAGGLATLSVPQFVQQKWATGTDWAQRMAGYGVFKPAALIQGTAPLHPASQRTRTPGRPRRSPKRKIRADTLCTTANNTG